MPSPKSALVALTIGAGALAWWLFGFLATLAVLAVAILVLARRRR